jgi:hypothetical protein
MTNNALATYVEALNAAFAERKRFEAEKAIVEANLELVATLDNASEILTQLGKGIVVKLNNLQKGLTHEVIAKLCLASKVDANFINREEKLGARYNVYAAKKVLDTSKTLASAGRLDHYTLHALKTALAFSKADLSLTHADMHAAYERSKVSGAKASLICYFERAVAHNTATTQASSSLNALQSFEVLNETRDASGAVAYTLNAEHKNAKKLLATLA